MPFPVAPRVIYRKNPLVQVICQVRFPPILRIDTESPADFQERIRTHLPGYNVTHDDSIDSLHESLRQTMPPELRELLSLSTNRRHLFYSRERMWTVSLARDFVALETNQYEKWEDFRERLRLVINALFEIYEPAYLTRIGLRYKNLIDRRRLGLEGTEWQDLFADFLLGQFARNETSDLVVEHHGRTLIKLNDDGDLVRLEFGQVIDSDGDASNKMFLLDHDFYREKEITPNEQDIISRLNAFNTTNRHLFSWEVTEKLQCAMAPVE